MFPQDAETTLNGPLYHAIQEKRYRKIHSPEFLWRWDEVSCQEIVHSLFLALRRIVSRKQQKSAIVGMFYIRYPRRWKDASLPPTIVSPSKFTGDHAANACWGLESRTSNVLRCILYLKTISNVNRTLPMSGEFETLLSSPLRKTRHQDRHRKAKAWDSRYEGKTFLFSTERLPPTNCRARGMCDIYSMASSMQWTNSGAVLETLCVDTMDSHILYTGHWFSRSIGKAPTTCGLTVHRKLLFSMQSSCWCITRVNKLRQKWHHESYSKLIDDATS